MAALLILPLTAAAAPRGGNGGGNATPQRDPAEILHNGRLLARYLQLSTDQAKTLKTLLDTLQAKTEPLREQGKALRETLRTKLEAASPNPCDVGSAAIAVNENYEDIEAAQKEFDTAFSGILTPAQLAKYEALKELVRPRGDDGEES
jgi:Spy/CpxP family protein refolding chaperone